MPNSRVILIILRNKASKTSYKPIEVLKRSHAVRVISRKRANATINRTPIGVMAKVGYLDLVREAGSTCIREECRNELHSEKYICPCTVKTSSTDQPKRKKRKAE